MLDTDSSDVSDDRCERRWWKATPGTAGSLSPKLLNQGMDMRATGREGARRGCWATCGGKGRSAPEVAKDGVCGRSPAMKRDAAKRKWLIPRMVR